MSEFNKQKIVNQILGEDSVDAADAAKIPLADLIEPIHALEKFHVEKALLLIRINEIKESGSPLTRDNPPEQPQTPLK